jgi:predicted AAA+ superfamily ATPase
MVGAYLRAYLERDLPQLGVRADPIFLRRLLTMLAHAQGGMLNASSLGASLDVSYHTIARHLDILEQTFLVRRLPPFFRNVGKRLVKAPRLYLRDTSSDAPTSRSRSTVPMQDRTKRRRVRVPDQSSQAKWIERTSRSAGPTVSMMPFS